VDRTSVTSRVAQAASRTVVDTIMEAEEKSTGPESDLEPGRTLALAESRPNAILDGTLVEPLGTLATEAMAGIPGDAALVTRNDARTDIAHAMTSRALSGLVDSCDEQPKPPCHRPPPTTRASS
jgi:hypothetical protein